MDQIAGEILVGSFQQLIDASGGDVIFWIKISGIVSLVGFVLLTGFVLRGAVVGRKRAEFEKLIAVYSLEDTIAYKRLLFAMRGESPSSHSDAEKKPKWLRRMEEGKTISFEDDTFRSFFAPVLFTAVICTLGAWVFVLGLETRFAEFPNAVFSGSKASCLLADYQALITKNDPAMIKCFNEVLAYQSITVSAIGYGFMGAYLFSMLVILRRMMSIDLTPSVYYNVSLRIIFSIVVAIVFRHFVDAWNFGDSPGYVSANSMIPVFSFFAGMTPYSALTFMKERMPFTKAKGNERADSLVFEMIEGISIFKKVRLNEIALDDAHNLAVANPLEIAFRTPYKLNFIMDWVSQSQLFLRFGTAGLRDMRSKGIRNIFDFYQNTQTEEDIANMVKVLPEYKDRIQYTRRNLDEDPCFARLGELWVQMKRVESAQRET